MYTQMKIYNIYIYMSVYDIQYVYIYVYIYMCVMCVYKKILVGGFNPLKNISQNENLPQAGVKF